MAFALTLKMNCKTSYQQIVCFHGNMFKAKNSIRIMRPHIVKDLFLDKEFITLISGLLIGTTKASKTLSTRVIGGSLSSVFFEDSSLNL